MLWFQEPWRFRETAQISWKCYSVACTLWYQPFIGFLFVLASDRNNYQYNKTKRNDCSICASIHFGAFEDAVYLRKHRLVSTLHQKFCIKFQHDFNYHPPTRDLLFQAWPVGDVFNEKEQVNWFADRGRPIRTLQLSNTTMQWGSLLVGDEADGSTSGATMMGSAWSQNKYWQKTKLDRYWGRPVACRILICWRNTNGWKKKKGVNVFSNNLWRTC